MNKGAQALRCHYFRQKVLFVANCLPGAFAKAVIITTEAVGTPPTNANKGAQALRIFLNEV